MRQYARKAHSASNVEAGGHLSYIYLGQNFDNTTTADAVVVYEKLGNHGNQGTNVLFKDGHVEWYDATQTATLMAELTNFHKRGLLMKLRTAMPGVTLTDLKFRAAAW